MSNRGKLKPGKPTPILTVPESIERPEYVWKDEVQEGIGEPYVQSPEVIEKMREACKIAAIPMPMRIRRVPVKPDLSDNK